MTTLEAPQNLQTPEKQKIRILTVTLPTIIFLILFAVHFLIPTDKNFSSVQIMWQLSSIAFTIAAIAVLVKNGRPEKKYIIFSAVLAVLMFAAYYSSIFSAVTKFIEVFVCALASFSVFKKYSDKKVRILHSKSLKGILVTLALSIAIGGVLGTINLFLSSQPIHPQVTLSCFLTALSPAICEETVFRLFPFAFILYLLHGTIRTKFEAFFVYVFMVFPHAITHTPDIMISQGVLNGLIAAIMLSILFGLPFALLMRKRDLSSAMASHGLVDLIRFIFIGL